MAETDAGARVNNGVPRRVLQRALLAGFVAVTVTVTGAIVASQLGVDFEVDGNTIPLAGFAWWTAIGAVGGYLAALVTRRRRPFLAITLAVTVLSLIAPLVAADDTTTTIMLIALHLITAAIIIPPIAGALER